MVNKNIFLAIAISITIAVSCQTTKYPVDRNGLSYCNKLKYNRQIRIDGYFHSNISTSQNYSYISICYFFHNGIFCTYTVDASKYLVHNNNCLSIPYTLRDIPYCWGYYIIEEDIIKIQTFNPYRGSGKYVVEEKWAKILNDTTIHLFKKITPNLDIIELNTIYNFKSCIAKPDSINLLTK